MRKNVLRLMMTALFIAVAVPFVKAQVQVGDILCEGNRVVSRSDFQPTDDKAIGVIFYVDNTQEHGWAVSLQNESSCSWGPYGDDAPLTNCNNRGQASDDLDGYGNTETIRNLDLEYPAFEAVRFADGWYLPAAGQMKELYANIKEVDEGLSAAGGDTFQLNGLTYWTSSEYSETDAWHITTIGGLEHSNNSFDDNKGVYRWVRSVRDF